MPNHEERMRILEGLEKGEISSEEAVTLLKQGRALPPEKPLQILERLEKGEINTQEAAERLSANHETSPPPEIPTFEHMDSESVTIEPSIDAQDAWRFLVGIGVVVVVLSSLLMATILKRSGMDFWFYCAWLPLALGVALTAFGWFTRNSTWMQLSVRSKDEGHRIFFTLPLPVEAAVRWASQFGRNPKLTLDFTDDDKQD
jgi:hypothetical protein